MENTSRSSDTGLGGSSSAGIAPSYVNVQYLDRGKPKGKHLTEGGFDDSDSKNASFTSDIGTKDDPGRLAEQRFELLNAESALDAGTPKQKGFVRDNPYEALGEESPA